MREQHHRWVKPTQSRLNDGDGFDLIMQDGQRANDFLSSLPPQSETDHAESKILKHRGI
jgi:hypothetical protein